VACHLDADPTCAPLLHPCPPLHNSLTEPEQKRESSLKYQTRCIAAFPDDTGYALGSVEGRMAMEYYDPNPAAQAAKYAFKVSLAWWQLGRGWGIWRGRPGSMTSEHGEGCMSANKRLAAHNYQPHGGTCLAHDGCVQ
jgi:hypothetical protein